MVAHATLLWGSRRRMGTAEDLRSRGASVFMQATAFMGRPSGSASMTTRPPPCARSYLGRFLQLGRNDE